MTSYESLVRELVQADNSAAVYAVIEKARAFLKRQNLEILILRDARKASCGWYLIVNDKLVIKNETHTIVDGVRDCLLGKSIGTSKLREIANKILESIK